MRAPREIAAQAFSFAGKKDRHPLRETIISREIEAYGDAHASAAREEGRREAFRSALDYHAEQCTECGGPDDGCEFGQWLEIRALASQPKPEPEQGKAP